MRTLGSLAVAVALASCLTPASLSAQDPRPGKGAVVQLEDITNEVQKNDGWISLFNGKNLDGWIPKIRGHEAGVNFGNTFRVENGVLRVSYDGYEAFDQRFGHLFHEAIFSSYLLKLEYRFYGEQCPGGPGWAFRNSGIMVHGQSPHTMTKDQEFPVSIEVQLLGGRKKGKRTTLNLCTPGTNVVMDKKLHRAHCTNSKSKTYRGDGWVEVEVEVRGNQVVRHRIGDKVVLEYQQPQLDDRDADAKQMIEARDGEKLLDRGTISLQSESHGCEFRNIRIKALDDPKPTEPGDAKKK